jgi:hypothetical protein
MRAAIWAVLGVALAACGSGTGKDTDADDTLPKRGELSTDPTIVAATALCEGELMFKGLTVIISASDPMGAANLGACAATNEDTTHQSIFEGSRCVVDLTPTCVVGTEYAVDITVSNLTAGVTTASVKVRPQ